MNEEIRKLLKHLEELRNEKPGTIEEMEILLQLSQAYLNHDTNKALQYSQQASETASRHLNKEEQIKATSCEAEALYRNKDAKSALTLYYDKLQKENLPDDLNALWLYRSGFALWENNEFEEAEHSFRQSLEAASSEDLTADNYTGLGLVAWRRGNPEQALDFYRKALTLYENCSNQSGISKVYNYSGIIYKIIGDFDKALDFYKKALEIQENIREKDNSSKILNNIGNIHLYQGKSQQALDFYHQASKLAQEIGNFKMLASIENNIGLIYFNLLEFSQAQQHHQEALKFRKLLDNELDLAHSHCNVGICWHKLGDTAKAVEHLETALQIEKKLKDKYGIACALSMLGMCKMDKKELNTALKYYRRSRKLYAEIGDRSGEASAFINEGTISLEKQQLDEAEQLLLQGLKIASGIDAPVLIRDCYYNLSEIYKARNDCRNAFKYFQLYVQIKDQVASEESKNRINDLQTKFEFEKQKKDAEIYKLKNVKLAQSNKELKILQKELEKRVENSIAEIRKKDSLLISQSRQAAMGEMISFIAHQWKQPLNTIGVIVQNIQDSFHYGQLTENKIDSETVSIMNQINYMSETINDFRDFFKTHREKVNFNPETVIKSTVKFIQKSFQVNNIELILQLNDSNQITGFPNEFSQVILNILNNAREAFKVNNVSNAKKVTISLKSTNELILINIADNAGGIGKEVLSRIFEPYISTKLKADGTGLGLYMAKTIIEEHFNGKLYAKNSESGAEFIIELNKN